MGDLNLNRNSDNNLSRPNFALGNESIISFVNKLKQCNSSVKFETDISTNSLDCNESLISRINKKIANNEYWFSLEFFPPKTLNGAANLIQK